MASILGTPAASTFESYFDAICQGNKGDARLERLDLDGTTISYRVVCRHYHVWDSWVGRVTMYDITTPVEGSFDAKNPATWTDQKACVDTPLGTWCVSLNELVPVLISLLAL